MVKQAVVTNYPENYKSRQMSDYKKRNPLSYILTTILFIAIAALSWFLLDTQTGADAAFTPAVVMMLKAAIILAAIIVIASTINQIKTPAIRKTGLLRMQEIIEDTTSSSDSIRTAIIRLRQVLDPEHMKLAVGMSTLLDQLIKRVQTAEEQQSSQQQELESLRVTVNELKSKHEKLIKAPHLRSEFLSRMGDEITLPMKSLGNMLKLLKNMELDTETRDLLVIATHSAHSLIENLSNILEFSKLDAQLYKLDREPFNVAETISSVLETQESIALAKTLMLESNIRPDVPENIKTDKKAVMKVLDNLISNAIRFTDHGQIRLDVENLSQDSKKLVRFTVSDTGVGIPENALPTLFDSLDKDTQLVNSSFTGRLRLIVSKGLCEAMGGEIGVRSQQGKGSQFWFTIDLTD